jgi:tetratricopeptide (TPR) repeat protein/tRNA A-37 threonylcarbamoyl transferase component Bud32
MKAAARYLLGHEIARGGMGVIYLATDTVLGREVAVKVLKKQYAPESYTARRFADEARITAQLQHPNIPAVHDLGVLPDGRPFLAMKLIRGDTLEVLLQSRRGRTAEGCGRFVAAFEQVCQAVAYAHAHDVIHRDLKPANVMVGSFGEVQVMDWGLAKVLTSREHERPQAASEATTAPMTVSSLRGSEDHFTQAGSVLGTPAYMPPEQAAGAVGMIDRRSDVFGLGAVLAVVLTGWPPFGAESSESARVRAAQGDVGECFDRLDRCGADPDLVALCKRCLAPRPADRPTDAGEVAKAVAALRAAADERARRAELDKTRSLERRRRRRLWLGAAAALALAALAGLGGVLEVQRQANADLAAKNRELADQRAEVEDRFELAQKAIATYHTGVSEDALLRNENLRELRAKLLKQAGGFYADLEKLLAGKTDAKSRKLLAEGYFQLGKLTEKIGDKKQALAVQRQALAMWRVLSGTPGAPRDATARLEVARTLRVMGILLGDTGDMAGALEAYQEERDLAAALEAESPTDAVRAQLASGHNSIGQTLSAMGKPVEALAALEQGRAIRQQLAEANPGVTQFQQDLAQSHGNIGVLLERMGKLPEALASYERARSIRQQLANANPTVTQLKAELAQSHSDIGGWLERHDKLTDSLVALERARTIWQQLAEANPAVTQYQSDLAVSQNNIGVVLERMGKPAEAAAAYEQAGATVQKLVEANPASIGFQTNLAGIYTAMAVLFERTGKPAEAVAAYDKARDILRTLADANPKVPEFKSYLARCQYRAGRLLIRLARPAAGLAALDEGYAICQSLADAFPAISRYRLRLGYSHAFRGAAHARAGEGAAAAADLRRAIELWAKTVDRDAEDLFERARALALLAGLGGDAKSGVTTAEAARFADQAVASLRDASNAGWNWPGELKEPDFDGLRGRADFQKLMAEVEAKAEKRPETAAPREKK